MIFRVGTTVVGAGLGHLAMSNSVTGDNYVAGFVGALTLLGVRPFCSLSERRVILLAVLCRALLCCACGRAGGLPQRAGHY